VPQSPGNLVYYNQCDPTFNKNAGSCGNVGKICASGCGITTTAMIVSSYAKTMTPNQIADIYPYFQCVGTYIKDAKSTLEKYGIQTSPYLFDQQSFTLNDVRKQFEGYLNSGWTLFVLVNTEYGGHFFWIRSINGNHVITYDPYFGKDYDQANHRFVIYRSAFAVKNP
jgi:ABC-type bacteriocin/lantibiotic exporter with double-glycine peptidase domain